MTDAPERIYMDPDIQFPECEKQYFCDVEYVRADLYEALERELESVRDFVRGMERNIRCFLKDN